MTKNEAVKKIQNIKDKVESEGRTMNANERLAVESYISIIDGINHDPVGIVDRTNPSVQLGQDRAALKPFGSMGEQLLAIRQAFTPGQTADARLYEINQRAATGLNEGTPSEGGFLLQNDFSNQILQKAFSAHPLLSLVNRIPLTSNSIKLPAEDETSRADGSRHGGVRGYWLAEASEKQASKPKFRTMELNLHKVVVLIYSTDELLEDAAALDGYLRRVGPDELGWQTQNAIINGTGVGQPLGILNSGCLVTADAEGGQDADSVVYENIVNMWSRMPARNRRNAVWLINQDIEPQLFTMSLVVGTGGVAVYMPSGQASGSPYSSLFGRPVIPVEQCQTLGDAGDIILADPTAYILADKSPQADVSIHVRFIYDESVYRFVYRVDGQPERASALTPANGTNTLSPFVTLAART